MKIFNTYLTQDDKHRGAAINQDILGWSGFPQYGFFKAAFAAHDIKTLLMLGVYMGRDLAYVLDILKRYHPTKAVTLIGVDKFSDTPCADWTPAQKAGNWEAAGFGPPPTADIARANLEPLVKSTAANLVIIQADDAEYLKDHSGGFDLVYLDTSHDGDTVRRQILQCLREGFLNTGAILCGDDYIDRPEWGVIKAVDEALPGRLIIDGCIWVADL
jgi:hypothetical protein